MKVLGRVASLWRYPVKSMRGEELTQAFAGFGGFYGDRWYAFLSSGSPPGFPYMTAREKETMLLYTPAYRYPDRMFEPTNLQDAQALGSGVTPLYGTDDDWPVDVTTPDGTVLPVDDPALVDSLREGIGEKHQLTLRRSHRAMTDCRPISLFSQQTARQLSREVGVDLNLQRFRANIYLDFDNPNGFVEDELVGRTLHIGKAVLAIVARDQRCKMITLDPDTGAADPEVMRVLAREHEGRAGLYGVVVTESTIRAGDSIGLT